MKTFSAKPADTTRQWYVIDASKIPLGRLATRSAALLIGKGKPSITPHVDSGDYVIIINADSLIATGDKSDKKVYFRHSGYPGGLYKRTLAQQMDLDSAKVVQKAIRGMLPINKLRAQRLTRLKIYPGEIHGHNAQKPTILNINNSKEIK